MRKEDLLVLPLLHIFVFFSSASGVVRHRLPDSRVCHHPLAVYSVLVAERRS